MKLHFIAGAGLGLLVGVLTGMSVSPVVASLLGTLAAAAVVFVGLHESSKVITAESDAISSLKAKAPLFRIIGFCLAAVIGVLSGAWLKSQNLFEITPKQQMQALMDAGFSTNEAKQLVLIRLLESRPGSVASNGTSLSIPTVLYGQHSSGDFSDLDPSRIMNASEVLRKFRDAGGNWNLAATIAETQVPEKDRMAVLTYFWELLRKENKQTL